MGGAHGHLPRGAILVGVPQHLPVAVVQPPVPVVLPQPLGLPQGHLVCQGHQAPNRCDRPRDDAQRNQLRVTARRTSQRTSRERPLALACRWPVPCSPSQNRAGSDEWFGAAVLGAGQLFDEKASPDERERLQHTSGRAQFSCCMSDLSDSRERVASMCRLKFCQCRCGVACGAA